MWCEYIIFNFVRRNILILQNRQTSEDSIDLNQWYILVLGCVWIVGAERMDKTWLVYCWWHNMRPFTKTHTVKPTEASNPAMVKPLRVTWPYAALVWCCANTCQTTQPTFSEPPKLGQGKVYFRRLLPENWGLTGFWGESKSADIKVPWVMSHVFVDVVLFAVHIIHVKGVHIYESI